jgi:malic enzyme
MTRAVPPNSNPTIAQTELSLAARTAAVAAIARFASTVEPNTREINLMPRPTDIELILSVSRQTTREGLPWFFSRQHRIPFEETL